jgi:hypothetical protein
MSAGHASSTWRDRSRALRRLPLPAGGALTLVLGVATGLDRLGWNSPVPATLSELHGPLMACGFFGTVIAIERAVALGQAWTYLGPLASVSAAIAGLAGLPVPYAQAGWLGAGLLMLAASCVVVARHCTAFTVLLAIGAAAWPIGTFKWSLGAEFQGVALWWMAFLVLTIAAERLELNRVLRPTTVSQRVLWAPVALVILAALGAELDIDAAWRAAGAALLGLAAWLLRHDVARRTIRFPGLPRYAAACLLSGYGWLAIAALLMLGLPLEADRLAYDAALHAVFLGFVFAMVFGHAPIILPAVAGVQVPFGNALYAPLALLNLSVAARVGGDLLVALELRRWSGALSAAAIASFIALIVALIARGRDHPSPRPVCAGTKTDIADGASLAP